MKTIHIDELSRNKMLSGNKPLTVILCNEIKEFIGFGWIGKGEPSEEDIKQYPVVVGWLKVGDRIKVVRKFNTQSKIDLTGEIGTVKAVGDFVTVSFGAKNWELNWFEIEPKTPSKRERFV